MADAIKCTVCGESNPADQEFCQYCQSRLQPLTGPLKGADAPLHPGQIPTKKVTAELEPILPQWLRDARDKARSSAEDVPSQGMQQQHEQAPSSTGASEPDLLAGLQSQARGGDDEEDTPDWLASITGVSHKSKKVDPTSSEARRVELGDIGDFAQDTAPLEDTPSWLASMQAASQDTEKDELKDWFRESSGSGQKKDEASSNDSAGWPNQQSAAPSAPTDAPDWLRQMSAEGDAGSSSPPSWLDSDLREEAKSADPNPFARSDFGTFEAGTSSVGDAPGWLQGGDSDTPAADALPDNDWLKGFDSPTPDQPLRKNTTPLWLKSTENPAGPTPQAETPVWLEDDSAASLPPIESQPAATNDEQISFGEIPGWLKAAAPQSSIFDSPAEDSPAVPPEASGWLSTFQSSEPVPPAPFSLDQTDESAAPAAFTPDAFQDGSADTLFTEMPDWLSNASAPASNASPLAGPDSLTPGELPSWVQAMRPVGGGISQSAPGTGDQTLETRGALSGLHGVLPAVPGYAPSSKPRVYSIKLQATQEQQSHAALLEQILAAEAEPVPITSFSPLRTSHILRWFLSVMVFGLMAGMIFLRSEEWRMPSVPPAIPGQISPVEGVFAVVGNIPADGLILVAMDYHPARAAEMEALASPMFDQMMILHHPHLVFISTNETGPLLAERFMSGAMGERAYRYKDQYLNLGYLPGGVMGIRSFVENPKKAAPFDIFLDKAWETPLLNGVSSLSQFAGLIVITDNADSARAWIEQSTPLRSVTPVPLVVISSAQAGPMLTPYYASGQLNGLVNGLYEGAIAEQKNGNRPGTVRLYWGAYSLGMLMAVSVMLGGGLWHAVLGLQDRAAKRGMS